MSNHTAPDLNKLANELDKYWPENSMLTCSKFTWAWICEATDGMLYQHGEKSGNGLFIYFSPKQDGFYASQVIINNRMGHYKIKVKKAD